MSDAEVVVEEQAASRDPRRIALIALGAVAVLALLWFFVLSPLLGGGTDEASTEGFPPPKPAASEQAAGHAQTATQQAVQAEALPVETYEVYLSRDPFEPVVPAPAAAGDSGSSGQGRSTGGTGSTSGSTSGDTTGGSTSGGTAGGSTETPPPIDAKMLGTSTDDQGADQAMIRVGDVIYTVGAGDTFADGYAVDTISGTCATVTHGGFSYQLCEGQSATPAGGGTTNGAATGCTSDGQVVCDGREVSLVDVYTKSGAPWASVRVDSTIYDVTKGDVFASNFQMLSVDTPCATMQYGDDTFTLCEGDRVLK